MKRLLQLEDMRKIEYLSALSLSPDGKKGLYVVRTAGEEGDFIPHIYGIDLDTGKEGRLLPDMEGEAGFEDAPAWSPDGSQIAFLRTEGADAQLWVMEAETGRLMKRSHLRHGVEEFAWSPDGSRIAFTSRIYPGEEESRAVFQELSPREKRDWEESRAREPVVIENLMYKMDEWHGIQDGSVKQIGLLDLETEECRMLTGGAICHYLPSWSPDGTRLACCGKPHRHTKEQHVELFVVDLESGALEKQETGGFGVIDSAPSLFTPDGTGLIYLSYREEACGAFMEKLFLAEAGKKPRCLFPEEEVCHGVDGLPIGRNALGRQNPVFQLGEDGEHVYFLSGWMGAGQIFRLGLRGEPHIEAVTKGKIDVHSFTAPCAGRILFTRGDLKTIADLYCLDDVEAETGDAGTGKERACGEGVRAGGSGRRLTEHNRWLREIRLSEPKELWVESKDRNVKIHGFVLPPLEEIPPIETGAAGEACKPLAARRSGAASEEAAPQESPGRIPGKKYPAVLDIHGGPTAYYSYDFWFEFQMLAASGMAVAYCDPRGSSGFGAEFSRDDYAWGQESVDDLRSFLDAAIGLGFIDEAKLGVTGGSYGGHMTNRLIATTDWFAAAASQRNLCNMATSYGTGDMGFIHRESGTITQMENFMGRIARAPITKIDRIKTPLLILHATKDYRCGFEQAEQLFIAMKDRNPEVPVRLVAFPGENHGMTRDGKLHFQMAHLAELVRWFSIYLKQEAWETEGSVWEGAPAAHGREQV